MLEETSRLKRITERLLLLAVGDSGQLKLNRESVDVYACLRELVEDMDDGSLHWKFDGVTEDSAFVFGDPDLLRKVFQNLLDNAIKYNRSEGTVKVNILCGSSEVCIRIGNTGMAIPTELQPFIFDRFVRSRGEKERRIEGTGLGLSIVKEIVQLHGGRVELMISKEDWTEFEVKLPWF